MIFGSILSLSLLALSLSALAEPHSRSRLNRHNDLSKRASGDMHIYKRFSSSKWSFYDVGLGACGQTNVESDFIVALNSAQYGSGYPGPNCFKSITMTYNGKTATATIMDQCPGCPYGGLDLSRGLFRFFAAESVGIIYGEWSFNDGSGSGGNTATTTSVYVEPAPTTTKKTTAQWTPITTWTPEPTTTWTPEPTTSSTKRANTSTWVESATSFSSVEPTTSTVASSTSSSSAVESSSVKPSSTSSVELSSAFVTPLIVTSVDFSSGAASGLAVPTGTFTYNENDPNNLNSLNRLFINLGGLVAGASKSN